MVYTHHQSSQQLNLLDPTAVAENRIAGGVGEVTGAIPLPRPIASLMIWLRLVLSFLTRHQADFLLLKPIMPNRPLVNNQTAVGTGTGLPNACNSPTEYKLSPPVA